MGIIIPILVFSVVSEVRFHYYMRRLVYLADRLVY